MTSDSSPPRTSGTEEATAGTPATELRGSSRLSFSACADIRPSERRYRGAPPPALPSPGTPSKRSVAGGGQSCGQTEQFRMIQSKWRRRRRPEATSPDTSGSHHPCPLTSSPPVPPSSSSSPPQPPSSFPSARFSSASASSSSSFSSCWRRSASPLVLMQCLACVLVVVAWCGSLPTAHAHIGDDLVVQTNKGKVRGVTLKSATQK